MSSTNLIQQQRPVNWRPRLVLQLLVAIGLWAAGQLAWSHHQTGEACPILGDVVPACYVAFSGFLLMAFGIISRAFKPGRFAHMLFWIGLGIAGGLALAASIMEVVVGDICPKAFGWFPMCYGSLAISIFIGLLYIRTNSKAKVNFEADATSEASAFKSSQDG